MSSTNLEELSNDEIRIRLLEYGFANLPVTQTTRKVLVKKLKNAMETQKTKNRRETVAVIRSSDEEDIPEQNKKRERTPNRRATLAVTEKTKKVPASSSSNESLPRSETEPTVKASSRRSSRATPAKEKPIVTSSGNVINEESDDDVVEVKTYTRRSKTPTTISKSETVRTSYKNEIVTDPVVDKKRYPEPIIEPVVIKQTTTRRKTYSVETEHFDVPPRTETPTKFGKSTLTTSFNPSGNYRFEKEQDDDDIKFDEKDTPYLSNFAKRLSTLKAEPLNSSYSKQSYTDIKPQADYGYSSRYSTQYGSSYQPAVKRQGIVNQMAKDFNSMDRKYSIRKYAFIAVLIMLIIFIYVLLFL